MKNFSQLLFKLLLVLLAIGCFAFTFQTKVTNWINPPKEMSYTELIRLIDQSKVKNITLYDNDVEAKIYLENDNTRHVSSIPNDTVFCQYIQDKIFEGDDLNIIEEHKTGTWPKILFFVLGISIIIVLFPTNQQEKQLTQASDSESENHDETIEKTNNTDKNKIHFSDVAGLKEEKEELMEIVDFLKNPQKYIKMGAKIPKGVLLSGPPGTGKTLLAKAVSGESEAEFFYTCGAEFDEMYVGVGASRIRELFNEARESAPSVSWIFWCRTRKFIE